MAEYNLLCYTAAHTDVHLGQQLSASLTPAIVLWEHGHLTRRIERDGGGMETYSDERLYGGDHVFAIDRCLQSSLVDQILQVSAREAHCAPGNDTGLDICSENTQHQQRSVQASDRIPVEDLCASFHVWFGYSHLHVKSPWADQGTKKEDQLELHNFLQLVLRFIYPFDVLKRHILHLDREALLLLPSELFMVWRTLMRWLRGTVTYSQKANSSSSTSLLRELCVPLVKEDMLGSMLLQDPVVSDLHPLSTISSFGPGKPRGLEMLQGPKVACL
ncbi:hypothetical protein EYF80_008210 [Liparis tanakae]|uniref:Uncharacterized protein n=1 Tax=Liparis tanakae TaxID=230148 RepID=A0A4Z2IV40_9TELE|nr:hypothetical protein EYF80_008210 [Liparis tanakae]